MLKSFFTVLNRDITLALRRRTDIFTVLFFFIIVVSLFPLGVGFEADMFSMMVRQNQSPGLLAHRARRVWSVASR